jgi:hypothetical protein
MSYRKSKILFLPGVFLSDCPDSEDEESGEVLDISLDDSEDNDECLNQDVQRVPKKYDELQTQYINRDLWKKKTNLLCWSCGLRFENVPYAIPIGWAKRLVSPDNLDDQTEASDSSLLSSKRRFKELPIMEMHGNFCQGGCAARYIAKVKDPKIPNRKESMELLIIFHNKLMDDAVNYIPLSDPRAKMHMYCGSIGVDIHEFSKSNGQKLENYKRAVEKSNTSSVRVFNNV